MFPDATFPAAGRAESWDEAGAGFMMDEDTFRAFYERTARGVWAYLTRLTGDPQLADDLLQETYYRFLRAAATYAGEAHRRNSLYRIATNLARDSRRRCRVRGPSRPQDHHLDRVPSADHAGAAERVADLTRALARLKPRERAMLWLAYAEGASHQEIADVLGLRPASLKAMLFRARRRLASLLAPALPGGEP
jgi:RNA polymerase sigma-70 factor (ECF subfamily)